MSKPTKYTDRKKGWNRKKVKSKVYKIDVVIPKKTFLIICEGQNTEPEYFRSFPLSNASVTSFGIGKSKTALIESIIDQYGHQTDELEIWAVFDMDRKEDQLHQQRQDYNNAIDLARQNGIYPAYSNDAFELWFVLHYQFTDAELHRTGLYQILSNHFACNYEKDGKRLSFCQNIYDRLEQDFNADMDQAIKNADRLFEDQKHLPFCDQNPCTTVYQLVVELKKYL